MMIIKELHRKLDVLAEFFPSSAVSGGVSTGSATSCLSRTPHSQILSPDAWEQTETWEWTINRGGTVKQNKGRKSPDNNFCFGKNYLKTLTEEQESRMELMLGSSWHGDSKVPACQVEFFCSYLSSLRMHTGFPKK